MFGQRLRSSQMYILKEKVLSYDNVINMKTKTRTTKKKEKEKKSRYQFVQ